MQIETKGQRNIELGFNAPKKFKLLKDGVEVPYIRTGQNSIRLSKGMDGILDLQEIQEQPRIVKPMQLQAQQMALVNPSDVLVLNQVAQQLEIEQNLLSESQKKLSFAQDYLDVQQQKIDDAVLGVQSLETDNANKIDETRASILNLAGDVSKVENSLVNGLNYVSNAQEEHKNASNPHNISKKTIGLDKVDNTSDIDKPISKAVQSALDKKADKNEIEAIREELGTYQEKNERFTNALSNYTGGLATNEIPEGGLQGQVLGKASDLTGDLIWVNNAGAITIDDELSIISENPVQNKVITNTLNTKADISDIPTVNDATLTIQKNSADIGTFTANASTNATINITVPTSASDVGALPDTTKYGSSISLTINSSTFVVTAQLKDQNGDNLGSAQTIDLPLESVVVNGTYDDATKKIILTLQNGNTIEFSVVDLVSGLQSEITSDNMLDADLVDDSTSINKFVTSSDKTTWNGKQDAISDLDTIRSGASKGATATQKITATNPALTTSSGVCTWTISNTLATGDVVVMVKEISTNETVETGITSTSSNIVIKINSSSNISAGVYKAIIIG